MSSSHPDPLLLDRYALGHVSGESCLEKIQEHLTVCEDCARYVRITADFSRALDA